MQISVALLWLIMELLVVVDGHGRLTIPAPRECAEGKCSIEDGDAPVNFNGDDQPESKRWPANNPATHPEKQSFVCRVGNSDYVNAVKVVEAGKTLGVKWKFTAPHPGDGGLYVSYDYNVSDRQDMKWFKIANFPQQRRNNNELLSVSLPAWLPSGRAVVRWDWYATHNSPYVEFYTNCIDVTVQSASNVLPSAIPSYKIQIGTSGPGAYPADDYCWDCSASGWNKTKIAGPACVGGVPGNCCDLSLYTPVGYTATSGGGFNVCKDKGSSGEAPWLIESPTAATPTSSTKNVASAGIANAGRLRLVSASMGLFIVAFIY